jgi:hypothetical protein
LVQHPLDELIKAHVLGHQATQLPIKRILNIGAIKDLLPILLCNNKTRVVELTQLNTDRISAFVKLLREAP